MGIKISFSCKDYNVFCNTCRQEKTEFRYFLLLVWYYSCLVWMKYYPTTMFHLLLSYLQFCSSKSKWSGLFFTAIDNTLSDPFIHLFLFFVLFFDNIFHHVWKSHGPGTTYCTVLFCITILMKQFYKFLACTAHASGMTIAKQGVILL